MIEGLKVTVPGTELKSLCLERATHHWNRAKVYEQQLDSMQRNEVEGMNYSNGDPNKNLADKRNEHAADAEELEFIADHLVAEEQYLLDAAALTKLGICRGRWH